MLLRHCDDSRSTRPRALFGPMAGVFALCLLACPSTPQPAREQWLSLRETGYPIECDGKPAVWKRVKKRADGASAA